ncbi:hypothetical protein EST38_g10761 [Candolleomyces aberdarensis]|uniref:BTB domain-containing protein n=1 Tax=Candolleomyces aberdarensis TaxID=2316362 RepID=A0A4Q2D6L1_9AGAR|nr:hypothetical protein EST38_g10761 [Candolleomyces aberdarensis]
MTATAQTNRSRKDEGTRVGLDSTQQRQEAQRSGDSRSAVPPPLPSRTSTGTATSAPASNLVPVAQPETDPGPLPVAGNVSVSAVHTSDRDLSSDGDSIPPISPNPEPQTRSNNHPESQAPPALKSLTPAQAPNDPSDDDHPQPFPKKTRREPADFPLPASLPPIEVDYSKYEIPDLSDTDDENDPDMIFPELTQLLNAAKGVSGKEKEKKDVKGKGRAKEEEEEQGEKMDVDQASGDEEEGVDQLFSEDRDDPNLGDGIGVGDAQKGADDRMDYETDPDDMYIQDTLISPSESRSPDHPPRIDDIRKKNVKKREREYDLVEPSPAPPASKRVKVTSNSASTSAAVISSTQQPKPQPRSKPRSTGSMAPPPSTVPPTFAESSISNASSNSSTNSNPNNQSSSLIAANYTKHPEFWQLDGSLQVQIRNVRFKLTRSRMVRISGLFKDVIDSVSSKARGKRRMGGVRVSWEGTMPVVTLDEEKVVSASDFEVWVRAVEDTFSYLASGPSLTSIYALQRASTALRSPSPLAHATKVVSDVWSGDLKKLTTTKLSGATEVLALSRKSGGIGGTMDGVVKRAMYELLRHETFEQEDSDSDEDDCEIFSVHGSSEEEDEVYPKNRSSKGGRHGDNRKKWKLPTKDVMLLTSARAKLQRRWMKDTAVYPGELLPCQGLSSSPTTSSTTSTSSGQLPPRAPSACPGTNPPLAQEVFRKLLLSAPSSAAESNLNDEDTIDHVEAYMDDVVCGYTALLSLPWRERAGFCDDCVERQRRMWSGTRERVWKDCEVLFGLRK